MNDPLNYIAIVYDGNGYRAQLVDVGDGPFGKERATDLGLPSDWDVIALVEAKPTVPGELPLTVIGNNAFDLQTGKPALDDDVL